MLHKLLAGRGSWVCACHVVTSRKMGRGGRARRGQGHRETHWRRGSRPRAMSTDCHVTRVCGRALAWREVVRGQLAPHGCAGVGTVGLHVKCICMYSLKPSTPGSSARWGMLQYVMDAITTSSVLSCYRSDTTQRRRGGLSGLTLSWAASACCRRASRDAGHALSRGGVAQQHPC